MGCFIFAAKNWCQKYPVRHNVAATTGKLHRRQRNHIEDPKKCLSPQSQCASCCTQQGRKHLSLRRRQVNRKLDWDAYEPDSSTWMPEDCLAAQIKNLPNEREGANSASAMALLSVGCSLIQEALVTPSGQVHGRFCQRLQGFKTETNKQKQV
ncbi:unnamed protein product [Lepidochelys olivacea]